MQDEAKLAAVADELADVFIYVLRLVNVLGVDVSTAVLDQLEWNELDDGQPLAQESQRQIAVTTVLLNHDQIRLLGRYLFDWIQRAGRHPLHLDLWQRGQTSFDGYQENRLSADDDPIWW